MDTQRLKDILQKDGSMAIVVGQSYGLDEMAAALSLYLALSSNGKNVSIVSPKQPLVEVSNLVGIDKVKSNFESQNGDLIVSFPYLNDEIGKVSYTLENNLLNIIVKPKEGALSFGEKDVIFRRSSDIPSVLVTVGVKRLSELDSLFAIDSLKDTSIVNIDRSEGNEGFGDVVVVSQGASSVSEQVANLLLTLSMPTDQDMSQNLMSGIISATQNFQSPKTSSLAFEMAGIMLRSGARREDVRVMPQPQPLPQPQPMNMPRPQRNFPQPQPRMTQFPQQQQPRSQQQPRQQTQNPFPREQKKDDAPPDWLTPKIFKGSTNVE